MTGLASQAFVIFREVFELAADEREAYLREACGDDSTLRAEVEALLDQDAREDERFAESRLRERHEALALPFEATATGRIAEAPLPEAVGQYQVVRLLGRGGMGIVYEAKQENPRRSVALKVLRPTLLGGNSLARFQHEAQVLGLLKHPGIAQVYEAGTYDLGDGPQPFFAMELVEGRSLLAWARAEKRSRREKLLVFLRICDAVQHAHQRGIVHRDLKPDNVLVTADGQPKILDFGVARATDADVQLTTMHTDAGQLVGTVAYMSPEQAAGDARGLTNLSDVYTLGVLLYQLLSDRLPHEVSGQSIPEAVRSIAQDEPSSLRSLDVALKGDLDTIVHRALAKEPEQRYESAAALRDDVQRFLEHEPILARRPSTVYQLRKFARRHKGLTAGVLLAFVALSAGLGGALWFASGEARQRRAADASRYRLMLNAIDAGKARGSDQERQRFLSEAPPELRAWEFGYLAQDIGPFTWQADLLPFHLKSGTPRVEMEFTPDGTLLASFGGNETLLVFDSRTGETVQRFTSEAGWFERALAVHDGVAAVGTRDKELRVLDLRTGDVLHRTSFEREIYDVAWNRDGSKLVVALYSPLGTHPTEREFLVGPPSALEPCAIQGLDEDTWRVDDPALLSVHGAYLVDFDTLEATSLRLDGKQIGYLAHRPDPHRLFGAEHGADATRLWRWDAAGGALEPVLELESPSGLVNSTALDAAGRMASITSGVAGAPTSTGVFRLWSAAGELEQELPVRGQVDCALSADGRFVALRETDRLRVLDRAELARVLPHESFVYELAFTPDGKTLVTYDWFHRAHLWDARDGRGLGRIEIAGREEADGWNHFSEPLAPTADGRRLLHCTRNGVLGAADLVTGTVFQEEGALHGGLHHDIPVADWMDALGGASSSRLIPFGRDGELYFDKQAVRRTADDAVVLDLGDGQLDWDITIGTHDATASFSPDGTRVAVARKDQARVYDLTTGEVLADLLAGSSRVYAVAWSPDGRRLATGTEEGWIGVWDVRTFELLVRLDEHTSYVHDLAWSPDGRQLASASGDTTARIWDSVPRVERLAEARRLDALRAELQPKVESLFAELGDAAAVAERLRSDDALDEDRRHEALRVVREMVVAQPEPDDGGR